MGRLKGARVAWGRRIAAPEARFRRLDAATTGRRTLALGQVTTQQPGIGRRCDNFAAPQEPLQPTLGCAPSTARSAKLCLLCRAPEPMPRQTTSLQ